MRLKLLREHRNERLVAVESDRVCPDQVDIAFPFFNRRILIVFELLAGCFEIHRFRDNVEVRRAVVPDRVHGLAEHAGNVVFLDLVHGVEAPGLLLGTERNHVWINGRWCKVIFGDVVGDACAAEVDLRAAQMGAELV